MVHYCFRSFDRSIPMRFALDIGGTAIKCAVVDDDGKIVRDGSFPTDPVSSNYEFAQSIVTGSRRFISGGNEKIHSVGAGMAGFCDGKRGIVFESPNLPNIRDFELARELTDGLNLPAFVDNDATCAAWGEYLFGGYETDDLLVVTLGTGIGGGLVLDGKLYRGSHGFAGEIGQWPLVPDGPNCPSGGKGCLEAYVGRYGFEEMYRIKAGFESAVEPSVIHDRARQGEEAAKEAWNDYGAKLGIVLAGAVNLLDLGAVILTGGVTGAWDCFSESLERTFNTFLITPYKNKNIVKISTLGGSAGILGAAFLDRAND
ncbi:MAG: ROK family protein [bacterium]